MIKKSKARLIKILFCLSMATIGVGIILYNLKENIIFFYPPSKIPESSDKIIKVGGIVKAGSIERMSPNEIKFIITDNVKDMTIFYKGLLPALFREGQGIVASGKLLSSENFLANELLTKHDENYMPPEIAKTIKEKT